MVPAFLKAGPSAARFIHYSNDCSMKPFHSAQSIANRETISYRPLTPPVIRPYTRNIGHENADITNAQLLAGPRVYHRLRKLARLKLQLCWSCEIKRNYGQCMYSRDDITCAALPISCLPLESIRPPHEEGSIGYIVTKQTKQTYHDAPCQQHPHRATN